MSELKPYPVWKSAVQEIVEGGYNYGDVITHDHLWKMFGLTSKSECKTYHEALQLEKEYRAHIAALIRELLNRHSVYLTSVSKQGYRICYPHEQVDFAERKMYAQIAGSLRRGRQAIECVRICELTPEQRRHQADACARLGYLQQSITQTKQVRRAPEPPLLISNPKQPQF